MMVGFRDEHGVAERGRQRCEWRQGHWATEWHPDSLYDPAGGVGSVRFCSQRASEFKGREQWTPPLAGRTATSGKNTWLEEPPCLALENTHLPCRRDAVFVLE